MYHMIASGPGCLAGAATCVNDIKAGWETGAHNHPTGVPAFVLVIGVAVVIIVLLNMARSRSSSA